MEELLLNNNVYNLLKKIKNNEKIDVYDLKLFSEEYIKIRKLEKYLNGIILAGYPAYNVVDKTLKLNADKNEYWTMCVEDDFFCEKLHYVGDMKKEPILNINFYNLLFLFVTIHELWHIEQKKLLIEDYAGNNKKYLKNLMISQINNNYYFDHEKAYHEYDANINAISQMSELNEAMKFNDFNKINSFFAYKILYAYGNKKNTQVSSPLKNNERISSGVWKTLLDRETYDIFKEMIDCYDFIDDKNMQGKNMDRILMGDTILNLNKLYPIYTGEAQTNHILKLIK